MMSDFPDSVDDDLPPPEGPGLFGDAAPVTPAPGPAAPYRVLARKYRPASFDDLIGQDATVRILRRAFALDRVAHAFMLTGVRGVGKTTTARIIARCLCCVGPDGTGGPTAEPCGVCANCTAILADRHPDVVEMDAASRTGVDDVREIIEATRFRPMQARAKVFIIDEVHMLSRNAFNALLKTLEEPPPHVTFIFATTELRKVPVTVLSRCQRFDLRRVRVAELAAHFARIAAAEGVAVAPDALEAVARAADGSVRDGLSLLDQAIARGADEALDAGGGQDSDATPKPGASPAAGAPGVISAAVVADMLGLADRTLVFDLLEAVMQGGAADALAITGRAHERGADLGLLLGDLLELTHTLTRLRTVPGLCHSSELAEAERTRGAALAERLSIPELGRAWQMLLKGVAEVEQAPDRRAAAEMVLIRLCHVAELPTPGELVRRLAGEPRSAPAGPSPAHGGSLVSATVAVTSPMVALEDTRPAATGPVGGLDGASGTGDPDGVGSPIVVGDRAATSPSAAPPPWVASSPNTQDAAAVPVVVQSAARLPVPPVTVVSSAATHAEAAWPGVQRPDMARRDEATANVPSLSPAGRAVAAQASPEALPVAGYGGAASPLSGTVGLETAAARFDTATRSSTFLSVEPGLAQVVRAVVAEAAAAQQPADDPPASAPVPELRPRPLGDLRDVAMLVAERQDPMLHAHLLHSVHLVRFAPPVIELRPDATAPRDLAPRLAALLLEATGTRWTIALSASAGEPTLSEQGSAADLARRGTAAGHPLVQAILAAFPGARIEAVHDSATDHYGLPTFDVAGPEAGLDGAPDPGGFEADGQDADPDMPDFAPADATPAEAMPDDLAPRGAMPGR
jgi:DNA polymerase-3 subunit gamma/tau